MTQRRGCGGLDLFRVAAALLVVAIHTGPLLSVDAEINYLITDIFARLAVPFFFTVTGLFLMPKVRARGYAALLPFLKKCALLYAFSTLLYLPLRIYNGSLDGIIPFLRDIVFDGTFYHLWYFPAVMLGACITAVLYRRGPRPALAVCILLYVLGLLGDSYFGLIAATPFANFYRVLFTFFDQTRNGFFFAPLFLLLGALMAEPPVHRRPAAWYAGGFFFALAALLGEGITVKYFSLARFDTMYLALPFCLWFLAGALLRGKRPGYPRLRLLSTAVYIIHPLCIVGIRGAAKLLGLTDLLVSCSPTHYLAVCAASAVVALPFVLSVKKTPHFFPNRAWIELDAAALRHNIAVLRRQLSSGEELMAVVKANAYGHGDLEIARLCAAEGVNAFAVATPEEGVRLRRGGVKGEILVLGWAGPDSVRLLSRYRLTQTVVSLEHARALDQVGRRLKVHIKLDTGMHRLGISWNSLDDLEEVFSCQNLRVTGLYTHLSHSDSPQSEDIERTQEQISRFYKGTEALQAAGYRTGALHIQSSYGLLNYGELPCRWARAGIVLYGVLSRFGDRPRILPELRPVLSLRAKVAEVRTLAIGETAGYGGAFAARRPSRLAVLTIGYADGLPRALSCGKGRVLLHGQSAPIAGLICMDQLLADVTDIPGVEAGDTATLIGADGEERIPAGELAAACGTITNEILSRLGPRLDRIVNTE